MTSSKKMLKLANSCYLSKRRDNRLSKDHEKKNLIPLYLLFFF